MSTLDMVYMGKMCGFARRVRSPGARRSERSESFGSGFRRRHKKVERSEAFDSIKLESLVSEARPLDSRKLEPLVSAANHLDLILEN